MADDRDYPEYDCNLDPATISAPAGTQYGSLIPNPYYHANRIGVGMHLWVYYSPEQAVDMAPHINAKVPILIEEMTVFSAIFCASVSKMPYLRTLTGR